MWIDVDFALSRLLVRGKDGRERIVDMREARQVLELAALKRAQNSVFVVVSLRRWGRAVSMGIVHDLTDAAAKRVGECAHPRSLRRYTARRRALAGDTLEEICEFLGHACRLI